MGSQITQFESQMSNIQNLFGHKDAEITRLMSEVSRLRSGEARLEERLAALSAAPSVVAANDEAQIRSAQIDVVSGNLSGAVEGRVVEHPSESHVNVVQSSMEQRLKSMMAAIQCLSDRMIHYEQNGTDSNEMTPNSNNRSPQPSGSINPTGPPEPPPDDGNWSEDEGGDGEDELIVEEKSERDLVDNRALQSAKLEPLPNNAADFRAWKNSLILMLGRLDISGIDYLTTWIALAFKVDSAQECSSSSGLVPRLDRRLASELIKGLKGIPELQFKVQGYIESCTRQSQAPRGRAVAQMISRHFDLDRVRGSLITSQSVFLVELNGYSVAGLQEFSSSLMRVLNQIPSEQWPNQRMLGEFVFHKLRTVRRLERVIDEIKRSPDDSSMREFNYFWGKLQEFLVEEREDVNARSIEQSLRIKKKEDKPKAKTPAVPAKASPAKASAAAALSAPKPKDAPKGHPKSAKGKSKGKPGKSMTAEEGAKTPCIFHQMPNGCVHGDNCHYSHVKSPPAKPKESKAKPKPATPKVAAAVAIVAALSSVVTDTGAGRHLVSYEAYEALQEQGYHRSLFSGFANVSHEKLNFSTGGGFKRSSDTIGFKD